MSIATLKSSSPGCNSISFCDPYRRTPAGKALPSESVAPPLRGHDHDVRTAYLRNPSYLDVEGG